MPQTSFANNPVAPKRPTSSSTELIISDFSNALPTSAMSATPVQDKWLLIPYAGNEISGQMLWSPVRNNPPDLTIPLPKLGRCKIHIGIYASGTWPWFFNLIGVYGQRSTWVRLRLRLSDADFFDEINQNNHPEEERLGYITETYWKTAELNGQSLVISPPRKEGYKETTTFLAHIRLVPDAEPPAEADAWPASTKKLSAYFDSNYFGHYVDSAADVKSMLSPLKDSDFNTIMWTTCREDSCYYPSKIGNPLPAECMTGVYPYWMGRDMKRMLDRGEDPLKVVCDVGHEMGLKVFASYRRMTCRMPPFVFPLHPEAMFMKRPDLWCADQNGGPIPHLSITYPEVRQRMIDLLVEQATNYDIDGVHLYFSRSVPFVYYEKPFLKTFKQLYGLDALTLPETDERIGKARAACFNPLLRELRQALDVVGKKRGRRFEIAMHAQNTVRNCLYYGIDVAQIAAEGLVDRFHPDTGAFLPAEMGDKDVSPAHTAEFVKLAKGTTMKIIPTWASGRNPGAAPATAQEYYALGVDGLDPGHSSPYSPTWQTQRRLGHQADLATLASRASEWERIVRFQTVAGMTIDLQTGVTTCG
ncbi:hypothetical protein BH10PLA1_BH10PLA1_04280 [soil metagenome]